MNVRKIYEKTIREHFNYGFIPNELKQSWVSVSKNGVNPRLEYWSNEKTRHIQLGNLQPNATYANLARLLHPSKIHICKMCGNCCSIFYVYPTKNTVKWIKKNFPEKEINNTEDIFEIYNNITCKNKEEKFKKWFDVKSMEELNNICVSDNYNGKKLSPGVMANPPDRLDGFHCYNSICGCRSSKDKGRSYENMKSYNRDRRCYEYYSDGNNLLANKLMGLLNTKESTCFSCNKTANMTGDHIGPISLGFIHDVTNIQALCNSCNSSKNNRLTEKDYNKLCELEAEGCVIVSWWALDCWNINKKESITTIQQLMDKNTKKFITIIEWLKKNKYGVLKEYIDKDYIFDSNAYDITSLNIKDDGSITITYNSTASTKKTKVNQQQRTNDILLENQKDNRKTKTILTSDEISLLSTITYDTFKDIVCKVLQA